MAFLPDKGAVALELVTATLAVLHASKQIDLEIVENLLRIKQKELAIDQSADVDAAIEVVLDLMEI